MEKLLACEQIPHPSTPESLGELAGRLKITTTPQLCGPWGLCVQKCRSCYKLIVCNAGNGRVDQFTLEGRKIVNKSQRRGGIIATSDGHTFVSDYKATKTQKLK